MDLDLAMITALDLEVEMTLDLDLAMVTALDLEVEMILDLDLSLLPQPSSPPVPRPSPLAPKL
jgi:hypothetical protein